MADTAAPEAAPVSFGCGKWADCSCALASGNCGCGDGCGCGTISVASMTAAMTTQCGLADCACGASCSCGTKCGCGGTRRKGMTEWIAAVKSAEAGAAGCKCTKVDGKCACSDGCACGGKC